MTDTPAEPFTATVNVAPLRAVLMALHKMIRMDDDPRRSGFRIPPGVLEDRAVVDALRDLAEAAGINPSEVTSRLKGDHYAHPYTNEEWQEPWGECRYCVFPERWHDPEGRRPPHDPGKDPHPSEPSEDNPNVCGACHLLTVWHDPEGRRPPRDPRL